jgi:proteasome accessory factor A
MKKVFGIETEFSIVVKKDDYIRVADFREFDVYLKLAKEFFKLPEEIKELEDLKHWENFIKKDDDIKALKGIKLNDGFFLPNGARFYVDYPDLEYSTPECRKIKDLIAAEKASNLFMNLLTKGVEEELNCKISVLKDNSDRKGHSFASHENYLLKRSTFLKLIQEGTIESEFLISFLITRIIFTGSGKIGIETSRFPLEDVFQISQRAEFIREKIGIRTVGVKNIINIRDEPHASPSLARLHIIASEASFCDCSYFLRIGTTQLILKMIEDGFIKPIIIKDPVSAIKRISVTPDTLITLENGKRVKAVDIQEEFLNLALEYFKKHQPTEEEKELIEIWSFVLDNLKKNNFQSLFGIIDWVTKKILIEKAKEEGKDLNFLKTIDVLYHDLNGIFTQLDKKGKIKKIVNDEQILNFLFNPPKDTRAYIRGNLVKVSPERVYDWELIRLDDFYILIDPLISRGENFLREILK